MAEVPTKMKAIVANQSIFQRIINIARKGTSAGAATVQTNVPVPEIADTEVLVKVSAAALNPTDWKHADFLAPRLSLIGCDFAGKVVKIGAKAPGDWKVGDRIAGAVHGGLYPDKGSFAQYLKIDGDLAWKLPDAVTDETAATFGVSAGTAMFALNHHLDLPWLAGEPGGRTDTPVLIYSGATATGLLAIQIAKLAGVTTVVTASPHSFDLVKEYGADAVFDYRSTTALDEIKKTYPTLDRALDCFSEGGSTEFCAKALGSQGGKVVTLLPNKTSVPKVTVIPILLYTTLGKEFQWFAPLGPKYPAKPEDRAVGVKYFQGLPQFAEKLRAPPIQEVEGGLDKIPEAMDLVRKGKVSGKKLVAKIE